jgi:predicted flap endonuclease-1-like 5' DNA nuclease
MFRGWGFMLGEIWVLLVLAALVGLIAGWLIWGRRPAAVADTGEADRLRAELVDCRAKGEGLAGRVAGLERDLAAVAADTGEADRLRAELADCRAKSDAMAARVTELERDLAAKPVAQATPAAAPVAAAPAAAAPAAAAPAAAAPAVAAAPAAAGQGARPAALAAPRGGKADDLKLIKGIGPKLEAMCNKLGFWHFDQIANWTPAELAWVDENLEGFKGRVTRDEWVAQARDLAAGKPPRQ